MDQRLAADMHVRHEYIVVDEAQKNSTHNIAENVQWF